MNTYEEYSASLTSDAFLYYELKQVLKLKNEDVGELDLRKRVLDENMFQYKSRKSASRLFSTVSKRIKLLDDTLAEMMLNEPNEVGRLINLYLIMKSNRLFFEFMNEVVRERYEYNDRFIEKKDINLFFIAKREQSEKVAGWADSSIQKMKQVIFKILVESGIMQDIKTGQLNYIYCPDQLKEHLNAIGDKKFLVAMGIR